MVWAFRILAGLNVLLLAITFFYQSPGEDPAGAGMRLGFGVAYLIALAVVLGLYALIKVKWVRIPLLVVLALPLLSIVYGISLSL